MVSRSRPGTLRALLYAWMAPTKVTPGNAPAVFPSAAVAKLQVPTAGAHIPAVGFAVFSLALPPHHRSPVRLELAGELFAAPRPGPAKRQVPGGMEGGLGEQGEGRIPAEDRALGLLDAGTRELGIGAGITIDHVHQQRDHDRVG